MRGERTVDPAGDPLRIGGQAVLDELRGQQLMRGLAIGSTDRTNYQVHCRKLSTTHAPTKPISIIACPLGATLHRDCGVQATTFDGCSRATSHQKTAVHP